MVGYQYDFMETKDESLDKEKLHDSQLSLLPANPLQFKLQDEMPELTKRELEIMHMILSGYSLTEVALKIFLSLHGIKFRLGSIYWKFGVANRLQLIKRAASKGLQFKTSNGLAHAFHLELQMRDFNNGDIQK